MSISASNDFDCRNCEYYNKPYWSVVSPCSSCSKVTNDIVKISNILDTPVQIETACLICGEGVGVWFGDYTSKICPKCRDAVMAMRKKMEE
jgi:hypothetical protein